MSMSIRRVNGARPTMSVAEVTQMQRPQCTARKWSGSQCAHRADYRDPVTRRPICGRHLRGW